MPTYSQFGEILLGKLCTGLDLLPSLADYTTTQAVMFQGWADAEVPQRVSFPSLIGDDHSPFEYSVAFAGDRPELRLLFEVQGGEPEALSNQRAAIVFNQALALRYGRSLDRFEAVRDLFLSNEQPGSFSLWHGVRFGSSAPELKIYLNPQTFGPARALPLMSEALRRLQLPGAVSTIERIAGARNGRDVLSYFSLDLSNEDSARIKVYFRHEGATPQDVDDLFTLAPTHRRGDVCEFTEAMVLEQGIFRTKAVTSCFAFTQASQEPSAATFHLPIAHYVRDDATSVSRSSAYLRENGQARAAEKFENAVQLFSPRPLESGVGVQSYASFRREADGLRFTAYLSPELFRSSRGVASCSRPSSSSNPRPLQLCGPE